MSKSAIEYIRHILDEITFLSQEASTLAEEQFQHDETRKRAFARSLEIIGEAVKNTPDDYKEAHPEIEWKSFAGLRDKLIHHYFGVDYALVWDVVKNELPDLKEKLQKLLTIGPHDEVY